MSRKATIMSWECPICDKKLYKTTHKKCESRVELYYLILKRLNQSRDKKTKTAPIPSAWTRIMKQ
jgi:hypothetical protein